MAAPGPVPALPDTERRTQYAITASLGPLNVGFQLYGDGSDYANWLEVYINGVALSQSGNWTLTSPSGSLATLPRPITDARITFAVAQTGTVQIVGAQRPRRQTQFTDNAGIPARDHNQALSSIEAQLREGWDRFGRTLHVPPGETFAALPPAASRASQNAIFDSAGNLTSGLPASGGASISSAMAPVCAAATIPLAQALLGIASSSVGGVLTPEQFGAVGDGVTDDTVAIQAMFTAALLHKNAIQFNSRSYLITASINITGPIGQVRGYGWGATVILMGSATQNGFNITTSAPMDFADFTIQPAGSVTPSAGAAIMINPLAGSGNNYSHFHRLQLIGVWNGIDGENCNFWWVEKNHFSNILAISLIVRSIDGPDQIGCLVDDNRFVNFLVPQNQGMKHIYCGSSGVLQVLNNRFDGGYWQVYLNLEAGVAGTGELFIQNNSFENLGMFAVSAAPAGQTAAVIRLGATSAAQSFGRVVITGNEISPLPVSTAGGGISYGVVGSFPTAGNLSNVLVAGNNFNTNSTAGMACTLVSFTGVDGLHISDNIFQTFSSAGNVIGISVDATSVNVTFGLETFATVSGSISTKHVNNVPVGSYKYPLMGQSGTKNIATATALGTLFSGTDTVTYPRAFDSAFPVLFTGGPTVGSNLPVSLGASGTPGATAANVLAIGASNATHSYYWQALGMF